ncbi:unnamed protein product [Ilex paraguariensis]|uniref:RRM domain-containing protein n=1 Tax=Ilex paraguariensis TaxID=185542 RepID=A0ABC8UYI9_9AQUA
MAFVNRIGSMLKQTLSKHNNLELSAFNTSLYRAIRHMSSSKLFVGGLSYGTDEMSLREAFAQHGEVIEARIIMDRDSGRSRGFGFVSFTSSEEASSAMQNMDGQDLHGRRIRVNYATERPRGGGFGGYGGGGYGGSGGSYGGASYGGKEEQLGGNQGRADSGDEGFGQDNVEGSYRDGDDEPHDYANTRG